MSEKTIEVGKMHNDLARTTYDPDLQDFVTTGKAGVVTEFADVGSENINNILNVYPSDEVEGATSVVDLIDDRGNSAKKFKTVAKEMREEWRGLSELEARETCRPSKTFEMIRENFWYEYDRAISTKSLLNLNRVWQGFIALEHWQKLIKPSFVCYVLTPPVHFKRNLKYLLDLSFKRLEEILNLEIMYKGKPNTAVINQILKVYDKLENRVLGPQTQRIEAVNKHLVATADIGLQNLTPEKFEALQAEINRSNQIAMGDFQDDSEEEKDS